jgi:hypothetical protein
MDPSSFEELEFFRSLEKSRARALLIGRRALVVLGLPVLTADYDFWLHIDDIEQLNTAAAPFGLIPSRTAAEARRHGRYVLENDEHIDVLVARSVPTVDGQDVAFEDVWRRRQAHELASNNTRVLLPSLDDLILTKRFGARPRDVEDVRLLQILKRGSDA